MGCATLTSDGSTMGPRWQMAKKHIRTPIYLADEARLDRMKRLRKSLGVVSDSELVRRLVDQEAERRGVFDDPAGPQLTLGLGPARVRAPAG